MARQALISCKLLKEALGKSNLRVLESTWVPKGTGKESFMKEHIPSARFLDMWEGVETIPTTSRPLPSIPTFTKQLEREGVTDSSHVILYDKGPVMFSARMWLQCKEIGLENVSVLDGGFKYWQMEGMPTETGEAKPVPEGKISVKRRPFFLDRVLVTAMLERGAVERGECQIVDTREGKHFRGEEPEPSPYTVGALKTGGVDPPTAMQRGHLAGSRSLPYMDMRDPDTTCFKSEAELQDLFERAGVDVTAGSMLGTCYNGLTACMIPLALSKLGQDPGKAAVYIGSWTEFGQCGDQKYIATGEA